MESFSLYSPSPTLFPLSKNTLFDPCPLKTIYLPSLSNRRFTVNCRVRTRDNDDAWLSSSSPYDILGVEPGCSASELKAAFRVKVKEYHPDVSRQGNSEDMIRLVIQAYEPVNAWILLMLLNVKHWISLSMSFFVSAEYLAGCPYSCVKTAPHGFTFATSGAARATSQGKGEDYKVQAAVGQCPRSCIHYVTPSQRVILEELLDSIIDMPYDTSAEADLLYSLIVKARFENNRYHKPKKQPKTSSKHVDWYE